MLTKSIKINNGLYMNTIKMTEGEKVEKVVSNQHFIFIIDRSYSMYYDLPKLRNQLKNKLGTTTKPNDIISIIYYSSNGDCGTIVEDYKISDISDIQPLKKSVDSYLVPNGCTGFVEPLELATQIAKTHKESNKDSSVVTMFMSDGYENQNSRTSIIEKTKELSEFSDYSIVVEYGDYANHSLLVEMSEYLNGSHIYAKDFLKYDDVFDKIIESDYDFSEKVVINVGDNVIGDVLTTSSVYDKDIVTYKVENSEVKVKKVVDSEYVYLTSKPEYEEDNTINQDDNLLKFLYIFTNKMNSDVCYGLLGNLGDKYLIDVYTKSIGKQRLLKFSELVLDVYEGRVDKFKEGKDQNYLPAEDEFCFLDLVSILTSDDNKLDIDHSEFKYSRTTPKKVQRTSVILDEDLGKSIDELEKYSLKFKKTSKELPNFKDIVFNSSRANISFRHKVFGNVDLTQVPDNKIDSISTFKYSTYTILKDGLLNVDKLPVKLTDESLEEIKSENPNILELDSETGTWIIDLNKLPIVNRLYVKNVKAEELAELTLNSLKLGAKHKVYNSIKKELFPKTNEAYSKIYGEETANWLKDIGVTDYNGFSPKYVDVKNGDVYYAPEIKVAVAGCSTIPTYKKLVETVEKKGKMNKPMTMMNEAYQPISNKLLTNKLKEEELEKLLEDNKKLKKDIDFKISKLVFAKLIGQVGFSDLEPNVNTLTINETKFTFNEKEVEVKM